MQRSSLFGRSALVGAICFVAGVMVASIGTPAYRFAVSELYQEQYGELVFKCDQAMREHFIAKARVDAAPNDRNATNLAQAELALIDCHDYDLLRKQLLRLGLEEADLAAMGLQAIEANGQDIREIVRIHEIRY